ncbi:MAG: hypothetical protein A3J28_12360 [Acidobacteria bacterium RIFCSPLOWO2_12_FULL_60_22]|nr:MAG: hypothetical protein A3J28_12360 [Acidobacteria bacterium RIFCSPLOWO2_12_FULL_60_22]
MKCPHCLVAFHEDWAEASLGNDKYDGFWVIHTVCPSCNRKVIVLMIREGMLNNIREYRTIYPKGMSRSPLPPEVPEKYSADYKESCLVLVDSPKASAALSRRVLQLLLRDEARTTSRDLADQIQEVLNSGKLPSQLAEAIDAIRNIGNFAAHPLKSTNTGEIVDVEPGEAEWLLDVLEGLFDFYFVQPAILQKKKAALNQKLQEAGKPPMK